MLYGILGDLQLGQCDNIVYNGVFTPENTSGIQGGWGLVWDGPTINSCTGDFGEYLRYNSSHKTSLYLACGMPLIIWDQSSLADWVKDLHIGITVSCLKRLDSAISAVSNDDYRQMISNARHIGTQLRQGYFLKASLDTKTTRS